MNSITVSAKTVNDVIQALRKELLLTDDIDKTVADVKSAGYEPMMYANKSDIRRRCADIHQRKHCTAKQRPIVFCRAAHSHFKTAATGQHISTMALRLAEN